MKTIFGMHEKCPMSVLSNGWILYVVQVGDSNEPHQGLDLSQESRDRMIRIQWKFGSEGGCYPPEGQDTKFFYRVETLVQNTSDCHTWIAGNEANLSIEGLHTPEYTAYNYNRIRTIVHSQSNHENDIVLLPPIGPWNVESGIGWIDYFVTLIGLCDDIDGFAIHTYAREQTPESVISEDKMDAPYDHLYKGFRTYRDWLNAIPEKYRDRVVYITETNANQAWENANTGFVQAAYKEIDDWNKTPGTQKIHAMLLYRWPKYDKWYIEGKSGVIDDLQDAIEFGYTIGEEEPDMPDNHILNPTFQEPYYSQDGIGELKVADKWRAGWDNSKKRPEYRKSANDWENSQQFFCTSDLMDGWVYQSVNVGNVGKYFRLVVTCALESKNIGSGIGDYFASIGIDRVGDANVNAKTVEWYTPQHQNSVDKWTELELVVPIENEWITVFIQSANRWRVSGSMFIKSAYGYVIDNPCANKPTDPPSGGSEIIDAIEQSKVEILQAIEPTVKITDILNFDR